MRSRCMLTDREAVDSQRCFENCSRHGHPNCDEVITIMFFGVLYAAASVWHLDLQHTSGPPMSGPEISESL